MTFKHKLKKIPRILRNEGFYGIYWRVMVRITGDPYLKEFQKSYKRWYEKNGIHTLDLAAQIEEEQKFLYRPLISIITPTYNTNPIFLQECIESVVSQTYRNWELILIDDNSSEKKVHEVLKRYEAQDPRIKVILRSVNGHIAEASNEGLRQAQGEWIALLDHDDLLWPNALFEVVNKINQKPQSQFIYSDEDKIAEDGKTHCDPFFKPDWSPHFLWSCNYITHFSVIKKSLIDKVGGFRKGTDGSQDWDLFLRVIDACEGFTDHPWSPDCKIQHINTIIYSWRKSETSTASEKHSLSAKHYAYSAQEKALKDFFNTRGGAHVSATKYLGIYDIRPAQNSTPLVSIIIPTHENFEMLKSAIESIYTLSTYQNYEVVIVSNNTSPETVRKYHTLLRDSDSIIEINEPFNFSRLCNAGSEVAHGDVFVFMNNDTEVRTPNWIEYMLSYTLLPEVGCVGPRLVYPNERLQNNGLVLTEQIHTEKIKIGDFVAPYFRNTHKNLNLGIGTVLTSTTRDYTAITGAVLMIERKKFDSIGKWDERFAVAFNDVDLGLRIQKNHFFAIVIPQVEFVHHESETIGEPNSKRLNQLAKEERLLIDQWNEKLEKDAFFNEKLFLKAAKMYPKY